MKGKVKAQINFAIFVISIGLIKYFTVDYNKKYDIYLDEL